MPFADLQFLQQMQALGPSPTLGSGGTSGSSNSPAPGRVLGPIMDSTSAPSSAPGSVMGSTPTPPYAAFQIPPLHPFQPSSVAPVSLPYSQYGGPEQTYFQGNTLQNFGWAGPINTANQAAAAAAAASTLPASTTADASTTDPSTLINNSGGAKSGGRITPKRHLGALNAMAKMRGV